MALLLDIELALAKGIPQLDGSVTATTDNLSVVGRERDGENIRGVTDESAGGETRVEVPETKGVVPGGGESELAIGGDDNVRHKVVVAAEDLFWATVGAVLAGERPDDDGLV